MIKAVFLDVDNTLLDFDESSRLAMVRALEDYGVEEDPKLFDLFHQVNDRLWTLIQRGFLTREELLRTRWNLVFQLLGLPLDGEGFETHFLVRLEESAVPVPGALELLQYLAPKYPLYVASNAPQEQQRRRLERAGMLPCFRDIFSSERVGAAKPDPAFFEGCFRELPGLAPAECLMIGDSLSADIRGAADFGMATCWFNFRGDALPEDPWPDHTVDRLEQIRAFL